MADKPKKVRDYYRTEEVAELLKVSPKTVTRWSIEGRLDPTTGRPVLSFTVTPGGHKRYRKGQVDAYAARMAEEADERDGLREPERVWVRT